MINSFLVFIECVVNGVSHVDGSQWYDQGCKECRCQNGVASCKEEHNSSSMCSNCSTISNIQCHTNNNHHIKPENSSPTSPSSLKCQLFDDDIGMTIKEYHNGQKWLEKCQECECLVRKIGFFFFSIQVSSLFSFFNNANFPILLDI